MGSVSPPDSFRPYKTEPHAAPDMAEAKGHHIDFDLDRRKSILVGKAKRLYAQRRRRDISFGLDLFGEPAWDILLDLYIARNDGKKVSAQSACIGAAVPITTALRYLRVLQKSGLVTSEPDGTDHRRRYVTLSDRADKEISRIIEGL